MQTTYWKRSVMGAKKATALSSDEHFFQNDTATKTLADLCRHYSHPFAKAKGA